MKNQFSMSLFSIIHIAFAYIYTSNDGFSVTYKTSYREVCHIQTGRFAVIDGLSVPECVKECGLRKHCQALYYRRRFYRCELFQSMEHGGVDEGNCIFINRSDITITMNPCGDCAYGSSCDTKLGMCTHKECLSAAVPENGKREGNSNDEMAKIKLTCNAGYLERNGVAEALCLENGTWSATANCVKDCDNPPMISNGHVVRDSIETASVICENGYYSSMPTIDCTESGPWENISCSPRSSDCDGPQTFDNGYIHYTSFDSALVVCDTGYQSSKTAINCTEPGVIESISCTRIACGPPPSVQGGSAVLDKVNGHFYMDTATVVCDDWFQSSTASITCTATGFWENSTDCIDCFPTTPWQYTGKTNVTKNGRQCQRWDSQEPHYHNHTDLHHYPESSLSDANNYCRNPEAGYFDPWCLTMRAGIVWEFCDVRKCPWT